VIVFEGLDKAGKSTQLELLRTRVSPNGALFTHMPSGLTDFSRQLYSLLETRPPSSGLARQLAHLASHSENISKIREATGAGSLVLDRWWWSTMAYGWYGGDIPDTGLSESAFRELIECIWAPVTASIVFLFLTPREDDANNVDGVADGYRALAAGHGSNVALVPALTPDETHVFIVDTLREAGLTSPLNITLGARLGD
jgi:thymidylate kinase